MRKSILHKHSCFFPLKMAEAGKPKIGTNTTQGERKTILDRRLIFVFSFDQKWRLILTTFQDWKKIGGGTSEKFPTIALENKSTYLLSFNS